MSPEVFLIGLKVVKLLGSVTPISDLISLPFNFYNSYLETKWKEGVDRHLRNMLDNVAVLQSTTALIGLGTVAGGTISAVNLYQTMKLRQEVKELKLVVTGGFIDLEEALKDQGKEVLEQIRKVAYDVEYKHHRTILVQAYGQFIQAVNWLRDTVRLPDPNARNAALAGVQGMLFRALADYENPEIYKHNSAAGKLRRLECAWAIAQTITLTYQLQGASEVVNDRLSSLQHKIREQLINVINLCEYQEELDFLFPEIARIHNHDLAALKAWQEQVDIMRNLSPEDLKELSSAESQIALISQNQKLDGEAFVLAEPPEQLLYNQLKEKSHFLSLREQLLFLLNPDLRKTYESYISQQAKSSGYQGLAPSNWQQVTDLTVANLYWFFNKPKTSLA